MCTNLICKFIYFNFLHSQRSISYIYITILACTQFEQLSVIWLRLDVVTRNDLTIISIVHTGFYFLLHVSVLMGPSGSSIR
jgi:hypothetical protein